jgi:RimJ/RimL family protein N-acetyltransferase
MVKQMSSPLLVTGRSKDVSRKTNYSFVKRLLTEENGYFSPMQFDHFQLRPVRSTDGELFFQLIDRNRPRLEDFFSGTVARTRSLDDTMMYVEEIMRRMESRTYFPFFLVDDHTAEFAGLIDVKSIDWNVPKAELGCFIDSKFEGQGISAKALSLMIEHLLQEFGFNKLFLRTSPLNRPAIALAERCGFVREGVLRCDYKTTKGDLVDLAYYGLIKEGLKTYDV